MKPALEGKSRYIAPLDTPALCDGEEAGGKGRNLAALVAAGFDVPSGFVLKTHAFERFMQENRLDAESTEADVASAPLPRDIERELVAAVRVYGDGHPFAVRSSAVGEDGTEASFAGQYQTVLDVEGPEAIVLAVRRCWASAFSSHLVDYRRRRGSSPQPRMAVVVQRMVAPSAAGVAFTANPVTGNREEVLVSVVRGLGERLVSGESAADEWVVRADRTECRRCPERAMEADQIRAVASLARAVEAHFGRPQDIEWALADGKLWLLQARPITALPDASHVIEWNAPLPGGWTRNFRLGEWLADPVTPLFESWLLRRLEAGFNELFRRHSGLVAPSPDHVTIHGWYFGSLNFIPANPLRLLWALVSRVVPKVFTNGRRAFLPLPPLHSYCIDLFIEDWRALLDRYRAAVTDAADSVERAPVFELPTTIDALADLAGEYFGMISIVSGYAWKVEVPLAELYRKHVEPKIGGSHQELLQGLFVPRRSGHDVQSLDWFWPTAGEMTTSVAEVDGEARRQRLERNREEATSRAREALATEPKLLARFDAMLASARRFAKIRDEQVSELTLAWPILRRALWRIGDALSGAGVVRRSEDVHFLTRDELDAALGNTIRGSLSAAAGRRRTTWVGQRELSPPLLVGDPPAMLKALFTKTEASFRGDVELGAAQAVVTGLPASPGRVTGRVRIIRGLAELDRLQVGEVLVAPATLPAWTPVFARAAAVVTDGGSVIAHAALVAREYGIPAIVATGNATSMLHDGDLVLVDGTRGVVATVRD